MSTFLRFGRLAASCTMAATCLTQTAITASIRASGTEEAPLHLTSYVVRDPLLKNIEAVSFLGPAGWKMEGGIVWRPETALLAGLSLSLSDPQSRAAITFFPGETFMWSPTAGQLSRFNSTSRYLGSLVMPVPERMSDAIIKLIVPTCCPELASARISGTENLPALADVILRNNQLPGAHQSCRAARVRFEYTAPDGTPMEEDVYAVIIATPLPGLNQMNWHLERSFSVRAERGRLDAMKPLLTTILASTRLGADWWADYLYLMKLRTAADAQGIKTAGEIQRILEREYAEIHRTTQESVERQERNQQELSDSFSQIIRGVENYQTPGGGTVELPVGYTEAWHNPATGEYLMSNDARYNPNGDPRQQWTRISPAGR